MSVHGTLCAWGVWYSFECQGPKPHTDAHPWAKEMPHDGKIWEDDNYEPAYSDEEMERAHEAFLLLSRSNHTAATILAAHYRDWRLSDRKAPQPFPDSILQKARNKYRLFLAGLERAA